MPEKDEISSKSSSMCFFWACAHFIYVFCTHRAYKFVGFLYGCPLSALGQSYFGLQRQICNRIFLTRDETFYQWKENGCIKRMRGFRFFSFKFIYPCRKSNKKKEKKKEGNTKQWKPLGKLLSFVRVWWLWGEGGGGGAGGALFFLANLFAFWLWSKPPLRTWDLPYLCLTYWVIVLLRMCTP